MKLIGHSVEKKVLRGIDFSDINTCKTNDNRHCPVKTKSKMEGKNCQTLTLIFITNNKITIDKFVYERLEQ